MKLFVYTWINKNTSTHEILGFGYNEDHERICVRIQDNLPYMYCHYEDIYPSKSNSTIASDLYRFHDPTYDRLPYGLIQHKLSTKEIYDISTPFKSKLLRDINHEDLFVKVEFHNMQCRSFVSNKLTRHYHADLNPILDVVSKRGIKVCGWINISSYCLVEKDKLTKCKEYIVSVNNINYVDIEIYPTLSVLSLDIETYSHDGQSFPNMYDPRDIISMICICFNNKTYCIYVSQHDVNMDDLNIISIHCKDEITLIDNYFKLVEELDPDIIIGYNNFIFDFKYIYRRYSRFFDKSYMGGLVINNDIHAVEEISKKKTYTGVSLVRFIIEGRINIDIYQYVLVQYFTLPTKSLNFLAQKFLNENKVDLSYIDMFKCLINDTPDDIKKVAKYCAIDAELPLKLFDTLNVLISSIEMANMCFCNMEEYYVTGQTGKYKNQLYNICLNKDTIVNGKWTDIDDSNKGGHVLNPMKGIHQWCSIIDFNSLYPSIIIAHNLCYTTYLGRSKPSGHNYKEIEIDDKRYYFDTTRIGYIPDLCIKLLEDRKKFKQLAKNATGILKTIYDQRQNSIKITANSIYGCFSTGFAGVATFREGAECITGLGRKYLIKTKDVIENVFHHTVVYGDTDSCMIKFSLPEFETMDRKQIGDYCIQRTIDICASEELNQHYTAPVSIKYELLFESVIFTTKKRYTGVIFNGDMYSKGSYRSTVCQYAKDFHKHIINMLLSNTSKQDIVDYINKVCSRLVRGEVDIDQLVIRTKVKSYYSTGTALGTFKSNMEQQGIDIVPGTTLELMYRMTNKVEVGHKLCLKEYVTAIDFKAYIDLQLLAIVSNELRLYDLGVYQYMKNFTS